MRQPQDELGLVMFHFGVLASRVRPLDEQGCQQAWGTLREGMLACLSACAGAVGAFAAELSRRVRATVPAHATATEASVAAAAAARAAAGGAAAAAAAGGERVLAPWEAVDEKEDVGVRLRSVMLQQSVRWVSPCGARRGAGLRAAGGWW